MNLSTSSIGERIATARQARGWSQTDLGKACDMAPTQVSRYEAGRAAPRRITLGKIAQALAVRYQWLASGTGAMDEFSSEEPSHPGLQIWIDGDLAGRLQNYAALSGLSLEEALMEILDFPLAAYDPKEPLSTSPENLRTPAAGRMRLSTLSKKVKVMHPQPKKI